MVRSLLHIPEGERIRTLDILSGVCMGIAVLLSLFPWRGGLFDLFHIYLGPDVRFLLVGAVFFVAFIGREKGLNADNWSKSDFCLVPLMVLLFSSCYQLFFGEKTMGILFRTIDKVFPIPILLVAIFAVCCIISFFTSLPRFAFYILFIIGGWVKINKVGGYMGAFGLIYVLAAAFGILLYFINIPEGRSVGRKMKRGQDKVCEFVKKDLANSKKEITKLAADFSADRSAHCE